MSDEAPTTIPQPAQEGIAPANPDGLAEMPETVDAIPVKTVDAVPKETVDAVPEETVDAVPEETVDAVPEETVDAVPEETVDAVPVLAEARPLEPAPVALPAVQAAAVAATGFVAGAATIALVKRHNARKLAARATRSAPRRAVDMLPIVGSRTFLVDVHLIAKPQE